MLDKKEMSCPARRMDGSGFKKAEDPALEVRNNCALAELMAAREAQDAALYSAWTGEATAETVTATDTSMSASASSLPPPVFTVPLSETCFQVDGHIYKIPDEVRVHQIEKSLQELATEREKEEAKWVAYWKEVAPVAPRPAWETTEEVVTEERGRMSEPLVSEPLVSEPIYFGGVAETKTESSTTDIPQIEVSDLS